MKAEYLETVRLDLKPLDSSFLSQDYVDWMNDTEVNKYLESGGDYTLEKLSNFLKQVESNPILFWAIVIKDSQKHIGNIKIDPISHRNRVGEYGILIGDKEEWGKGYAKEASQMVIDFCFSDKVDLRKITLGVVSENIDAIQLYMKLGFIQEGLLKIHAIHEGKWCDVMRMAAFNPKLKVESK
ncbi:GNAT family protein [uncultured Roseivirga sp.]|uniref:GNAT family N-acetyltransferase n=1 Tax=uncultured Roseivirga sp. TaxID=543088 RepID=UPI000D7985B9|nr:GNAT family protein [uncultured Roseivirga sp.]PWL30920.1 MAG: hypothetical protein DCO95_05435 [Roseivirga sp. XM-24bin3]